jgi:hypothetical protein
MVGGIQIAGEMNDHRGVLDCRGSQIGGEPVGDSRTAFQLFAPAHKSRGSDAAADKRVDCRSSDLTRCAGNDERPFHTNVADFKPGARRAVCLTRLLASRPSIRTGYNMPIVCYGEAAQQINGIAEA